MKESFECYILNNRLFVFDTSSHFIVYFENGNWHEECNIKESLVTGSTKITQEEALKIACGNDPTEYIEKLDYEDMLKNIYCP